VILVSQKTKSAISFLAVHGLTCHWGCAGVLGTKRQNSRANQNGELEPKILLKNVIGASKLTSQVNSQAFGRLNLSPAST
jgi:hypothetical protein